MEWFRKLYDWVLHWAETPYGVWALFVLAFCESSFFPVPPDPLLIALAISIPARSFRFALICSVGSVLGGAFGYLIGYHLMEIIGRPILEFYGGMEHFNAIQEVFREYDAWAIGIAGFTPVPYKVATIAAGACQINFPLFVVVSFLSRSARFFLVGGLIYFFGAPIRKFIDTHFNRLAIAFVVLLILGFVVIKYWL